MNKSKGFRFSNHYYLLASSSVRVSTEWLLTFTIVDPDSSPLDVSHEASTAPEK